MDRDGKILALRAHVSQIGEWTEAENVVRDWAKRGAEDARAHGIECEYAERFGYVRLRPDDEAEQPAAEV